MRRGIRWQIIYAFLLALAAASFSFAGCPLLTHEDADIEREFQNVCQAIQSANTSTQTITNLAVSSLTVTHIYGPFTNWAAYTPTFAGIGTASNTSAFWRRVGDTIEVHGYTQAGTLEALAFSATLPSGLSFDTAKMPANSVLGMAVGGSSALNFWSDNVAGVLFYDGSDATKVFVAKTATTAMVKMNGSSLLGTNNVLVSFKFSAPISGWSF